MARAIARIATTGAPAAIAAVCGVFLVSRLIAAAAGVRFDALAIDHYLQLVDPRLLQTRLLESVWYMHGQPPLFNLFLGIVLKTAPPFDTAAFNGVFLACGLCIAIGTLLLMIGLGVRCALAALVVSVMIISPAVLLYENWLMYEYPLAAMLVLSALFLHRFAAAGHIRDALLFFTLLACIALTRGLFHPLFVLLVMTATCAIRPSRWRSTLAAALVPAALLIVMLVKNQVLFGSPTAGHLYQQINLARMTVDRLSPQERRRLVDSGAISPLSERSLEWDDLRDYAHLLPPRPPTGIPILDEAVKSSGATNLHNIRLLDAGNRLERDAWYVLRHHPRTYLQSLVKNCGRCTVAANWSMPLSRDTYTNTQRLRVWIAVYNGLILGEISPGRPAIFLVVGLPVLVVFGALRAWRAGRLPAAATLAYMLVTIAWITALTVALSAGDQNRYRFMLAPFFAVLLALLLEQVLPRKTKPARSS